MSLKVVSRMAIGGICLAAAAFGAGRCSVESKNVDNILDEDVVELSQVSKADDISYEHNKKLDERLEGLDHDPKKFDGTYQQLGTYAATLALQAKEGNCFASTAIAKAKSPISQEFRQYEHSKLHPRYDEWKELDDLFYECGKAEEKYREEKEHEIIDVLCSEDTPNKIDCFAYITGALHREGLTKEEQDKLQEDLDNFDKALGAETNQTYAEKLAYRQFKKDSIVGAHILEGLGLWKRPDIRYAYKEYLSKTVRKPKP